MNFATQFEQHHQTTADDELAIDAAFAALSHEPAPYTVRQHVEAMEDAGASFRFEKGRLYQSDNEGDPDALQALRAKAHKAGMGTERKSLFDQEGFKNRLKNLEPAELVCLFDALVAGADAMLGVYNQPRVIGNNKAERAVSDVMDELSAAYAAIVSEAESRGPDQGNGQHLFEIVARYHLKCGEEPIRVASLAVQYAEAASL